MRDDVPIGEGELAGPPPVPPVEPRRLAELRIDALDRHPNEWMRWGPYSQSASATRVRYRMESLTDPSEYEFVTSKSEGTWWLYGICRATATQEVS